MSGFSAEILAKFSSTNREGHWKCPTCMVWNPDARAACAACETGRPGGAKAGASAAAPAPAPNAMAGSSIFPAGFTFGQPAAGSSAAPSSNGAGSLLAGASGAGSLLAGAPSAGSLLSGAAPTGAGSLLAGAAPSGAGSLLAGAGSLLSGAPAPAVAPKKNLLQFFTEQASEPCKPLDASACKPIPEHSPATAQSTTGVVLNCGSGDCEQLGHGDEEYIITRPRLVQAIAKSGIVRIAAGGLHTLALTRSGELWSWGCNDDSALGRDGAENVPEVVDALKGVRIVAISCGDCHSAALDADGCVWTWGTYKGAEGYLGFDMDTKKAPRPVKRDDVLAKFGKVRQVACGAHHTVAVTEAGSAVAWGYAEQGQLGRAAPAMNLRGGRHKRAPLTPYEIRATKAAGKAWVGVWAGGYCTYLQSKTGEVWACGLNNYGQLAVGHNENVTVPERVELPGASGSIVSISTGMHHSLLLTEAGELFAVGRGDSGQLGLSAPGAAQPPPGAGSSTPLRIPAQRFGCSAVTHISAAGMYSYAMTADGRVWSWGYGEMAQLANGEEQDELLPKCITDLGAELPAGTVLQLAAGEQHMVFLATGAAPAVGQKRARGK